MNILKKAMLKALPVYVGGLKTAEAEVSTLAEKALEGMSKTAKDNITKAVKVQDDSKVKKLARTEVQKLAGLDIKADVALYKRTIAPLFYDNQKSEVFSGIVASELVIDGKFCYEMEKSVYTGLKSVDGKYGEDGEKIKAIMKNHNSREKVQNSCDQHVTRLGTDLVKAVLKLGWDHTTVAGTKQPCAVALKTKFDGFEAYYNSNASEVSTKQAIEFKEWIAKRPNFLK